MAELKQAYPDAEFHLLQSSGGVFEVRVDGDLVFSKKSLGRHAAPGEVLELVKQKVSGQR